MKTKLPPVTQLCKLLNAADEKEVNLLDVQQTKTTQTIVLLATSLQSILIRIPNHLQWLGIDFILRWITIETDFKRLHICLSHLNSSEEKE